MIATIIITLLIAVGAATLIVKYIKDKKSGKSACGGGCAGCALHDKCHKV